MIKGTASAYQQGRHMVAVHVEYLHAVKAT